MKFKKTCYPLLLLYPICSMVFAVDIDRDKEQSIEKIEVKGKRPTRFYLKEFRRQEVAFYDLFNQLVEDPQMQVHCRSVGQFASRMTKRVCEPRFVSKIKREITQRGLFSQNIGSLGLMSDTNPRMTKLGNGAVTQSNFKHSEINALINGKNEELSHLINELLTRNPDLFKQYEKLLSAQQAYTDAKNTENQ